MLGNDTKDMGEDKLMEIPNQCYANWGFLVQL